MPHPKPVIGITASLSSDEKTASLACSYLHALTESGALPLLLPPSLSEADCCQLAGMLDGCLFSGGPDLHPFFFQEETLEGFADHSALRDQTELLLFSQLYAQKKPILGICRGIQLINLALGGDLYQDISAQTKRPLPIAHRQPFSPLIPSHHVTAEKHSLLEQLILQNTEKCRPSDSAPLQIAVNSAHHQAVRRPAASLCISASAPDGIIEALEQPDYPFLLGVQWHPELLVHSQPHARALFSAFVNACRSPQP